MPKFKTVTVHWTTATNDVLANSRDSPKGYDYKKGCSVFENVTTVSNLAAFVRINFADGTEYMYPNENIVRIKVDRNLDNNTAAV